MTAEVPPGKPEESAAGAEAPASEDRIPSVKGVIDAREPAAADAPAAAEPVVSVPPDPAGAAPAGPGKGGGGRPLMIAIGAALVVLPGAFVAYLLGRPMTERSDLGFATLVPGQTGHALHPSTTMFWVGVLCVILVGAGAGILLSALFRAVPGRMPDRQEGVLSWLRRHGWSITLFVLAVAVLVPTLGTAGLWDPWESHYGLVGLRMVEQDDWLSTCDMGWTEWFWSKPILLFWLMGLGLVGLGQDAATDGNPPLIEWAFRLPIVIMAIGAVMAVYLLASRRWSKRAGFIAGLALLTMPQFFFIARQAMTDMPFVASMTIALCLLALALGEPDERPAVGFSGVRGRVWFTSHHLLVVAITLVALPQALVVLTHNKERALAVYKANAPAAELRRLAADRAVTDDVIIWGSLGQAEDGNDRCDGFDCSRTPGDAGVPQVNERFRPELSLAHPSPRLGSAHRFWGLAFLLVWAGAVVMASRRGSAGMAGPSQRDVYLLGFYLMAGVATLAKGILGFALPGVIMLLYLVVSGEWRELRRLRIVRGAVVFLAAAGPWYTMMIVRHGTAWWNQFIVHDHFKRSASGVHGDRGPLGYFVEQLGIGTFPWAGLIPAALVTALWLRWKRRPDARPSEGERVALLATVWGVSMFVFFTVMSTKFHHYVFPALPGMALCVGLLLDRMIDDRTKMAPLVALGSLGFFAFVARDLTATVGTNTRGYERLIHLFMYKYDRAWPDPKKYGGFLDYSKDLIIFAAIFGVLLLLVALPGLRRASAGSPGGSAPGGGGSPGRLGASVRAVGDALVEVPRRAFVALFCASAIVFAGWGLHHYFNQISPHWSEGYLVKKYYELRGGPEERLIAYSLNWHGENCYTANRAKILMTEHGFQREWDDFGEWLKRHKGDTYYFIIGKGGEGGVKTKLNSVFPGAGDTVEVVGGDTSNKYDLARGRLCAPRDCPPDLTRPDIPLPAEEPPKGAGAPPPAGPARGRQRPSPRPDH